MCLNQYNGLIDTNDDCCHVRSMKLCLSHGGKGQDFGIENIPGTVEEYEAWNKEYEAKHMVYADSNPAIGHATISLFLGAAPKFLHGIGYQEAYCLMDQRLRAAMGFPKKTWPVLRLVLESTLSLWKWAI